MTPKTKKEEPVDNEDIRDKTLSLIENIISKKLPKDHASRIEAGIEKNSKNENGDFNVMLYTILTVKALQNLKSPYVITCIKNETWQSEDIVTLDKDTLNPEKWQKLQDIRLPKNIKKEMKKGMMKCKKCQSWYSDFTTAQTRGADEPSTLFFRCLECDHRWRI